MGQAASKAASRTSSRAAAAAATASKQQVVDPITGFSRGTAVAPQEKAQQQFLEKLQASHGPKRKEMPPDLVKFITDVGPVQKKEQKTPKLKSHTTAPKQDKKEPPDVVLETKAATEQAKGQQQTSKTSTTRTEKMRLAEKVEGFETTRNTNFSREVGEEEVGVDVLQLYGLLRKEIAIEQSLETTTSLPADDKKRKEQEVNLKNAMQHIELPTLLLDDDDSYVGAWPDRVPDIMQLHRGMTELPKSRVQLVLEDLWEQQQRKDEEQKIGQK